MARVYAFGNPRIRICSLERSDIENTGHKRLVAILLTVALVLQGIAAPVALAEQRTVDVDNHTAQTDQALLIQDITIDGVDAPSAGAKLDSTATVTAAGDVTWDVPVLWVRDDLQIDRDTADDGRSYLPVLAFFVPQGYALEQDTFTVTLSDSLTELFGTQEIISVFDASTGITYILPASLKDLFVNSQRADTNASPAIEESQREEEKAEVALGLGGDHTIVEVHCAQTAMDVLPADELQWLIELIIDYLEPQAAELLLNSFPSFRTAAENGEIGKQISLYIYYKSGDKDGKPEHESAQNALAYVAADAAQIDGTLKYCYMLAVDVNSLVKKDSMGKPIVNPQTGRYTLVREGPDMETFKNTIVHEMCHALMDDYNRTGMAGATKLEDMVLDANNQFPSKEARDRFVKLHYPNWFIEGTASAVENVYQFRYDTFQILRRTQGSDGKNGTGTYSPTFTNQLLITNYNDGYYDNGNFAYFDLGFCYGGKNGDGQTIDTNASRYVTGYLATLYLSELAARNCYHGESSIKTVNGMTTVDSSMLRTGLDSLLKWMHDGESLDALVKALSPKDGKTGESVYTSTDSFENQFIKGPLVNGYYMGDPESQRFVTTFLNYLLDVERALPGDARPNGSILFAFDKNFVSPLDPNKKSTSSYLQITNSNAYVPSTVKSETPVIGGGTSDPSTSAVSATSASDQLQEGPLPAAAKTEQASNEADETTTTADTTEPADKTLAAVPAEPAAEPMAQPATSPADPEDAPAAPAQEELPAA